VTSPSTERRSRRRALEIGILAVAALLVSGVLAAKPVHAATFTVNSTGDAGDVTVLDNVCDSDPTATVTCTLRAAIQQSNATATVDDTINFGIGADGGVKTISPASALPRVTDKVTIDGYTQPGASRRTSTGGAALKIELSGAGAGFASGLTLDTGAGGTTIRGLVINRFGATGVVVLADNTVVEGNYIGTNVSGDADFGNGITGVSIGSSGNLVGGTSIGAKNVVSGNNDNGVVINGATAAGTDASNNRIEGNFIGTDANGTAAIRNGQGVNITSASGNFVGGTAVGAGNLISGNTERGVLLAGDAANNVVQSNFIGTNVFGSASLFNGEQGVEVFEGSNNVIGGTTSRTGNIISGNGGEGVLLNLAATGNRVQGNLIGTGQNGASALGNSEGVVVRGPDNLVGGTENLARNVISANNGSGVAILGTAANGNTVQGNRIGTDASGTADLGNTFNGVKVDDGSNNTIGGTASGAGNTISGNGSNGIKLDDAGTAGNRIEGNFIGASSDGTGDLGNARGGVEISGASGNFVGGGVAGAGNVISGNDGAGVLVAGSGATANRILRNSIFSNTGLGVDLVGGTENSAGATQNDPKDPDAGPNALQNKPAVRRATTTGSSLTVGGNLNSRPGKTFAIQFFSNPSGNEGKTFLGQRSVTTNANGNASFTFSFNASVAAGQAITATATGAGNTSEFSAPRTVEAP
jgi:hypothetical protein